MFRAVLFNLNSSLELLSAHISPLTLHPFSSYFLLNAYPFTVLPTCECTFFYSIALFAGSQPSCHCRPIFYFYTHHKLYLKMSIFLLRRIKFLLRKLEGKKPYLSIFTHLSFLCFSFLSMDSSSTCFHLSST